MDYYLLTDLAAQVGHGLAISGAETFRVEDTIRRILRAYGIECEVFAIPNCLTISFEAANDGLPPCPNKTLLQFIHVLLSPACCFPLF